MNQSKRPRASLLVIEDDESLREVLAFNLEEAGFAVETAPRGDVGLERYDTERHDVVLTDIKMPGMDGLQVLDALLTEDPFAAVVVLTAFGSTQRALDAMRRGAFHYVEKPVNTQALIALLDRAVEHRRIQRQNAALQSALQRRSQATLIASSPAMNHVLQLVDKVAPSDATVLIRGESGTGKELVARALHERSPRADAPFIAVNCAAIPGDLLESVLFGHARGAFTGATRDTRGKFLAADGGTLFLDEIAEMSPELQSKLLRVLQDGLVERVGDVSPTQVDVRIITATHQDLEALVRDGGFRQDLYYRLNVIPIPIPPLRQRREDIPVLVRHFIRQLAPAETIHIDNGVDELLLRYSWPGNIRELKNIIERLVLLRIGDAIAVADVPEFIRDAAPIEGESARTDGLPFTLPEGGLDLMELERQIIIAALHKHGNNRSATARYLNIPRHVLIYRIEKYEITIE